MPALDLFGWIVVGVVLLGGAALVGFIWYVQWSANKNSGGSL